MGYQKGNAPARNGLDVKIRAELEKRQTKRIYFMRGLL